MKIITKIGRPITGGRKEMTPGNAQVTPRSKQAASQVSAPPAPFKNPAGVANASARGVDMSQQGIAYGNTSQPGKHKAASPGIKHPKTPKDYLADIGQDKRPNLTDRPVHTRGPLTGPDAENYTGRPPRPLQGVHKNFRHIMDDDMIEEYKNRVL